MRQHAGINLTTPSNNNFLKVAPVLPTTRQQFERNLQHDGAIMRMNRPEFESDGSEFECEDSNPRKIRRIWGEPADNGDILFSDACDEEDTENIKPSNNRLFINYSTDTKETFQLTPGINTNIRANFSTYCANAHRTFLPFSKHQSTAIDLLNRLRQKNAALNTYESMMEWHLRANGVLNNRQKLSTYSQYISRESLYSFLRIRYNIPEESYSNVKKITLPHSKAKVNIVWNDAQAIIQSLLTDPRIKDEDYLFFNNDPFAAPPDNLNYVQDLNTGRAYIETYHRAIMPGANEVLLPVIFYIDAANTGHFVDLPITVVKLSLGIFTRKARDKDHMWRTLGYLPSPSKHKTRGRDLVKKSGHLESMVCNTINESAAIEHKSGAPKAQDLHTMLAVILQSYVKLQDSGFIWDLAYQGKVYKNVQFVLFTPYLKLDSDEAEKLCGKYTSRTDKVKQICRYCDIPTMECDNPRKAIIMKTWQMIQELIDNKDFEELQNMSQHYIKNALYELRFGVHNNQGVHGACPFEMLHCILLGIFRYIRDCFFEQIGPSSQLADEINSLARQFGEYLTRQSQRNLPKTTFNNG